MMKVPAYRILSICGNCSGFGDDGGYFRRGDVIEEGLCCLRERDTLAGNQNEGALHQVAAVLDGLFRRRHALHDQSFHGVLHGGQGGITDGIGVLGYCGDHVAGAGQLLHSALRST